MTPTNPLINHDRTQTLMLSHTLVPLLNPTHMFPALAPSGKKPVTMLPPPPCPLMMNSLSAPTHRIKRLLSSTYIYPLCEVHTNITLRH
jgi:hypothetical protein